MNRCCCCGEECNPSQQACGRCIRNGDLFEDWLDPSEEKEKIDEKKQKAEKTIRSNLRTIYVSKDLHIQCSKRVKLCAIILKKKHLIFRPRRSNVIRRFRKNT